MAGLTGRSLPELSVVYRIPLLKGGRVGGQQIVENHLYDSIIAIAQVLSTKKPHINIGFVARYHLRRFLSPLVNKVSDNLKGESFYFYRHAVEKHQATHRPSPVKSL